MQWKTCLPLFLVISQDAIKDQNASTNTAEVNKNVRTLMHELYYILEVNKIIRIISECINKQRQHI